MYANRNKWTIQKNKCLETFFAWGKEIGCKIISSITIYFVWLLQGHFRLKYPYKQKSILQTPLWKIIPSKKFLALTVNLLAPKSIGFPWSLLVNFAILNAMNRELWGSKIDKLQIHWTSMSKWSIFWRI